MAGNVWERKIFRANEIDRWPFKHCVVLLADKSCVLYRFMTNVVNILKVERMSSKVTSPLEPIRLTDRVQMMPT